ncbi:hypothetical protein PA598K_02150 [Paenibacillus sp. 598K]|uniref:AraC family transcriptional regulator n=1 Tax=Paenibacillus sp. 598K TaxID=1117987 RepID=UPI000FF9D487|nr:AraC family transcriptional regulator [Paenibacillus sp. 598K]GBF73828.1 hypothetical protein PA598K_02150 [Paenibacillus sp. 598K]
MNAETADERIDEWRFRWVDQRTHKLDLSMPLPPFTPQTHLLWVVVEGNVALIIDGGRILLHPSQGIVFTPGTRVELEPQPGTSLYAHALAFEVVTSGDDPPQSGALSSIAGRTIPLKPLSFFLQLFESLEACSAGTRMDRFRRHILVQDCLYHVVLQSSIAAPTNSREAVKQTIDYIHAHYRQQIKLSDLAVMACVSIRQYNHIFRQITGTSPMDYVHQVRIERAKTLLHTSSRDMLSIAHQVGFKDEFYFSRRFKQQEGVSPTVYLRKRQPRVIGLLYTSHLLALGLTPIGAPDYHLFENAYVRPYLSDMQSFQWSPCDIEAIRAMEPDLILGYEHMTPGEYKQCSDIAEVVRIPWQTQDVYQQLDSVSAVIDKRREGLIWTEEHREKIGRVRQEALAVIGAGESCAALLLESDGFRLAGNRNMGHVLYESLGLTPHPLVQQFLETYNGTNAYSEKLPYESLHLYDADRMFVMVSGREGRLAQQTFRKLRRSEAWRSLRAVRQDTAHLLSFDRWWMYTPLAVDGQLDDVVRCLAAPSARIGPT